MSENSTSTIRSSSSSMRNSSSSIRSSSSSSASAAAAETVMHLERLLHVVLCNHDRQCILPCRSPLGNISFDLRGDCQRATVWPSSVSPAAVLQPQIQMSYCSRTGVRCERQHSGRQQTETQHSGRQQTETNHSKTQQSETNHNETQQSETQHSNRA